MLRVSGSRLLRAGRPQMRLAQQLAQMRSLHASTPQRKEEEPLTPGLVEKYQLDEPSRYIPLSVGVAGLATATGLYHWDAESQLMVLWVLFCGTVYSRAGPAIAGMMDEVSEQIEKEHQALEDTEINAVKAAIEAHQSQLTILKDVEELFETQKMATDQIVAMAQGKLHHAVRDQFDLRLQVLADTESKYKNEIREKLIASAQKHVTEVFSSDKSKDLKAAALTTALNVLANPAKAKKDPTVGNMYSEYFSAFAKKVNAAQNEEFTATPEMQKEADELSRSLAMRLRASPDASIEVPKDDGKFKLENF
uniref:ATP synthase subunit b n=1 Tax=Mucochytrium quahogii TaxID=96639 RepID=A0A7S2SLD1_9STRA|mmetsp:Transcript_4401/g.7517  ORF Transcript_4401/g.7517 Transcript_4401/m.7517 type:complete len:308 (-) Transcript_4401:1024-1947(-)